MSQAITITEQDILQQVKLSCQIPTLVEAIITRKVINDAAAEARIKVETEELQQAADQLRLMSKLNNADETFAWLKQHSLSVDDFEDLVYNNTISGKLAAHLFADKVEPWFYENQLQYAGAFIYEVILDDEELAMELYYELKERETNFAEIAYQYIEEKELKRKGGYVGMVKRQAMKPEISAKVFACTDPQILKPIVTSQGIHLIKVEELVQPQLDARLRYQILSDLFGEWVKKQVQKIEVINSLSSVS